MNNIEELKKKLSGEYGKVITLTDTPDLSNLTIIPTGSSSVDEALGIGGLPMGRMCVFVGQESSGKSTLALHVLREAQKLGYSCMVHDAEYALSADWLEKIGVNQDELLVSQPETAEACLNLLEQAIVAGVKVHLVDSVAALTPSVELNGEIGDQNYALLARLLSQAMRKLTSVISKHGALVIFINQLRENVGVMGYGPKETSPGGRALRHGASIILDIRRTGWIKDGEVKKGMTTKVIVTKNKVAPPHRIGNYELYFDRGIDDRYSLIDQAVKLGVAQKGGAWYTYKDVKSQGKDRFLDDLGEKMLEEIKEHIKNGTFPGQNEIGKNPFSAKKNE